MKSTLFVALLGLSLGACNGNNSSSTNPATDTAASALKTESSANTAAQSTKTPMLKEENVSYTVNGVTMKGYIVYDSSIQGKRPGVLVIPEWWGFNEYPKMRARKLAGLGYVGMAVDMYGGGKVADNPAEAQKLAMPFYSNLKMTKSRFDAALNKLKETNAVDTANIGAIGYCFGGGVVLNVARLGENIKSVVSFHGNLVGAPANKSLLKAKVLVCQGAADSFVKAPEVAAFKKQMDSISADYTFKEYADATHAFTNPDATATGEKFKMPIRYNPAADTASWNDMKDFFEKTLK